MIVQTGMNIMASLLIGSTGFTYNNASAYLGVGSSSTAATVSDSALGTELGRAPMDTGYPTIDTSTPGEVVVVYSATFDSANANGSWQEWGLFNQSSSGIMLNHTITNNGVKVSGQTWIFQVTITYSRG